MPANKDFKRLVRSRMRKTGESYTSARYQLLRKSASNDAALAVAAASPAAAAPAAAVSPAAAMAVPLPASRSQVPGSASPAEYARLASMSEETLKAKTGCTWERWVKALDRVQAYAWPHSEIAEYVHQKYKVPGWWSQNVTVGYERIRGLREKGQRRGGAYEATRSKTFPVPIGRLFRAFSDKRARSRWLDGVDLTIRTQTKDRSMRIGWSDGTTVSLWFTAKGKAKSQVAVQHLSLPDRDTASRMKEFWTGRLDALAVALGPAKAPAR